MDTRRGTTQLVKRAAFPQIGDPFKDTNVAQDVR